MTDSELFFSEREAIRLFGELDRPAFMFNLSHAVVVNDRLLLWSADSGEWYMAWCPDPTRPHVVEYYLAAVQSRADVTERSRQLELSLVTR